MSANTRPPEGAAPSGDTGPGTSGTLFPEAAVSFGGRSPAEGGAMTPPGAGDGPDGGEAGWAGPGPGDG
ncbi:DNA processing Smf-family protein, partial [Streptomyces violaceoruber]